MKVGDPSFLAPKISRKNQRAVAVQGIRPNGGKRFKHMFGETVKKTFFEKNNQKHLKNYIKAYYKTYKN